MIRLAWVLLLLAAAKATSFVSDDAYRCDVTPTGEEECGPSVDLREHEYCIVGAGAAGLQLGYFLKSAGHDYVIIERNETAGAWYRRFPRHRGLISLNKRNNGKNHNREFSLRHDWHSLLHNNLSEAFLFTNYSKDLFPKADLLAQYFEDYAAHFKLNIHYNTNVMSVFRPQEEVAAKLREKKLPNDNRGSSNVLRKLPPQEIPHFHIDAKARFAGRDNMFHKRRYQCRYVVIATGYAAVNIPPNTKGLQYVEGYEHVSTNPDDFEGQSVLIFGAGNSAFETADAIAGRTNYVHLANRKRIRLSFETHYVGDIRAINNKVLDQYQLKSLDAIFTADLNEMEIRPFFDKAENRSRFIVVPLGSEETDTQRALDNSPFRKPYDRIIRATGFKLDQSIFPCHPFSAPRPDLQDRNNYQAAKEYMKEKLACLREFGPAPSIESNGKFPLLTSQYESANVPNLYFAGALSHGRDYRLSSGGFVHGFRYTIRSLFRIFQERHHGIPFPSIPLTSFDHLMQHLFKRLNEASSIYQMFGHHGEVITVKSDKSSEMGVAMNYYEDYPIDRFLRLPNIQELEQIIVVTLEYHPDFKGSKVFDLDRAVNDVDRSHLSNFLHPIIRVYLRYDNTILLDKKPETFSNPELKLEPTSRYPFIYPGWRKVSEHHIIEDFHVEFNMPDLHIRPARFFLRHAIFGRQANEGMMDKEKEKPMEKDKAMPKQKDMKKDM